MPLRPCIGPSGNRHARLLTRAERMPANRSYGPARETFGAAHPPRGTVDSHRSRPARAAHRDSGFVWLSPCEVIFSVIGRRSRTPPSPPWRWAGHHPWLAGAIVGLASSLLMLLPALRPSATNRKSVVLFAMLFGFAIFPIVGIHNTVRFGSKQSTDLRQPASGNACKGRRLR
jgi:hypothetical protein